MIQKNQKKFKTDKDRKTVRIYTHIGRTPVYYIQKNDTLLGEEINPNNLKEMKKLDTTIFNEIVKGNFVNGKKELKRQVEILKNKCDAILLACTELPLLIEEGYDYGIPLISSNDALIEECYQYSQTH